MSTSAMSLLSQCVHTKSGMIIIIIIVPSRFSSEENSDDSLLKVACETVSDFEYTGTWSRPTQRDIHVYACVYRISDCLVVLQYYSLSCKLLCSESVEVWEWISGLWNICRFCGLVGVMSDLFIIVVGGDSVISIFNTLSCSMSVIEVGGVEWPVEGVDDGCIISCAEISPDWLLSDMEIEFVFAPNVIGELYSSFWKFGLTCCMVNGVIIEGVVFKRCIDGSLLTQGMAGSMECLFLFCFTRHGDPGKVLVFINLRLLVKLFFEVASSESEGMLFRERVEQENTIELLDSCKVLWYLYENMCKHRRWCCK